MRSRTTFVLALAIGFVVLDATCFVAFYLNGAVSHMSAATPAAQSAVTIDKPAR
jgi:hypothetical protein